MPDLPPRIQERIEQLCDAGEAFMIDGDFDLAASRFYEAWQLLPEPRETWSCAIAILASIGDAHFYRRDFAECKKWFMQILRDAGGSPDNPFIRLRLGQCLFELGDEQEAANWLAGAYLLEGCKLFAEDDPKYLAFIKSKLQPPPDGWPEGW
jgi:hypothetical protein